MPYRTRSRDYSVSFPGSVSITFHPSYPPYTYYGYEGVSGRKTCYDQTSPHPYIDKNLLIDDSSADPLRISGVGNNYGQVHELAGYNPQNRSAYGMAPSSSPVDWENLKTKALANMNPYRPKVDVPLFLFELKDMPRMIRDFGRVLKRDIRPSSIPDGHLAYQFGWAPLVSDLGDLIQVGKAFSDRSKYFESISGGGASVQRKLGGIPPAPDKNGRYTAYTALKYILGYTISEQNNSWFTSRIDWRNGYRPKMDTGRLSEPERASLGLSGPSLSTAWNALPWSWLIDYFYNVGEYLEANRGLDRWKPSGLNLMNRQIVVNGLTGVISNPNGLSSSGGALTRTQKQRSVHANPTASITFDPALSRKQVGILASLALSKALKAVGS